MEPIDLPERNNKDIAHSVVKGVLSSIPLAGNLVAELFEIVVEPSYNKRLQEWIEKTTNLLAQLQEQIEGFNIKKLAGDEEFVSIFIKASQLSQRTHIEEKRAFLISAVKNSITQPLEFDKKNIFLSLIEQFSVRHIQMLKDIDYSVAQDANFDDHELKPHLRDKYFGGDELLFELFLKHLSDNHLLYFIQTGVVKEQRRIWTIHLSQLGVEFIAFIN